jgi:hypothetical protein
VVSEAGDLGRGGWHLNFFPYMGVQCSVCVCSGRLQCVFESVLSRCPVDRELAFAHANCPTLSVTQLLHLFPSFRLPPPLNS